MPLFRKKVPGTSNPADFTVINQNITSLQNAILSLTNQINIVSDKITTLESKAAPTTIKNLAADDDSIILNSAGTPYTITKANLFAGLSSGGGDTLPGGGGDTLPGGSNPSISRTFVSSGDTNGVFYYLGTVNNVWSNPDLINTIVLSSSSVFNEYSYGSIENLVGRNTASFATNNIASSSIQIDLKDNRLKLNRYTLQSQTDGSSNPRNWTLRASNNLLDWTVLDTASNQSGFNYNVYYLSPVVPPSIGFRYFQFTQNGQTNSSNDFFILNEIEFYGDLN